jgi:hypothetical protein
VIYVSIIGIMLTPWGCLGSTVAASGGHGEARKGLEGFSHGAAGAGARERGAPASLSFLRSKKSAQILKNLYHVNVARGFVTGCNNYSGDIE